MDNLEDSEWDEMIAWCPTQLCKRVYIGSIEFVLYLRWRHDDPFTYSIYIDDHNQKHLEEIFEIGIFSDGLFEKYGRSYGFKDFDKDVIEKDAEDIWNLYEKPRILKIIEENPEVII